jgi:hypothetical protein
MVKHHRNVHNLFMWKSYVPNLCFYIVNNKAFHFIYRGRYLGAAVRENRCIFFVFILNF